MAEQNEQTVEMVLEVEELEERTAPQAIWSD
jgi:hypothetical protein